MNNKEYLKEAKRLHDELIKLFIEQNVLYQDDAELGVTTIGTYPYAFMTDYSPVREGKPVINMDGFESEHTPEFPYTIPIDFSSKDMALSCLDTILNVISEAEARERSFAF